MMNVHINSSADGVNWPATFQTLAPESSIANAGPALAAFKGNLYLAWVGGGNQINIFHSADGVNFGGKINLAAISGTYVSNGSPSLTATANYLILSWLGTFLNGSQLQPTVYTSYSTDGVNWSSPLIVAVGPESVAPYSPAVVAFDDPSTGAVRGCVGFVTPAVFSSTRHIVLDTSPPGSGCGYTAPSEEPFTTGFGMGVSGTDLYLIWVGTHLSNQIRIWHWNSVAYVGETQTSQTSNTNPAITGFNGHVFYAWSGSDNPSHVNVAQLN
jgi:hypothetical protein